MAKKYRHIFITCAVIYLFIMVWIMFLQREPTYNYMINLKPFVTVKEMIGFMRSGKKGSVIYGFENIFGNIFLFAPIGIFLPAIWKKQNNFLIFLVTAACGIIATEAIQYFTCLGMADIDDLILNMIGAVIGFWFFRASYGYVKKR